MCDFVHCFLEGRSNETREWNSAGHTRLRTTQKDCAGRSNRASSSAEDAQEACGFCACCVCIGEEPSPFVVTLPIKPKRQQLPVTQQNFQTKQIAQTKATMFSVSKLTNLLLLLAACVSFAHAGAFGSITQDVESFQKANPTSARMDLFRATDAGERRLEDGFGEGACSLGSALECFADQQVVVGCSGLAKKNEDEWCNEPDGAYCCGDDCCKLTGGGIAVYVIVGLVIVALITLCSCACCSCCPWHSKLCCANCGNGGGGGRNAGAPTATAEVVGIAPQDMKSSNY